MAGIAEQIKELVRTAINHGRRIRRLETLQAPLAVARPQGGHVIQDEGVALTDRVYLNFVGVRVEATDDPDNGATIITVSDPEGDDFCRVVPLDVGWQISAGTESRYMKHSSAFQLDRNGNTRGVNAIDLQQDRDTPEQVAAALRSVILGGRNNEIIPEATDSMIMGSWNEIVNTLGGADPSNDYIVGEANVLDGDCYELFVSGVVHEIDDSNYGSYFGYGHIAQAAFNCFSLGESNEIIENVNDFPTYCGNMGLSNIITGEVWWGYQMGDSNYMEGDGGGGADSIWMCWQNGYNNRISDQGSMVFQFGGSLGSYLPVGLAGDYFSGRMMLDGDTPNETSTNTPAGLGFNQNSWFGQNTAIDNWTVAWISSRFQFPIIEDSIWGFTARILGTELGCANTYDWLIEGAAKNDGGTTTILWSIVTNNYRDVATKEWQVVADDPNDRLVFQYRDTNGPDATRCNIEFMMHSTEVGYES